MSSLSSCSDTTTAKQLVSTTWPDQLSFWTGLDLVKHVGFCGIPLFVTPPLFRTEEAADSLRNPHPSHRADLFLIIKTQAMDKDLQALIEEPFQERPKLPDVMTSLQPRCNDGKKGNINSLSSLNSGEWIMAIYPYLSTHMTIDDLVKAC